MFLVAICGPLGCGKSTLGRLIAAQFKNPKIIPFAYPLKMAAVDLGWDGKKDDKGRRLLQLLGTEIGRECIDENIWINKWEDARISCKADDADIVIADDCRFLNEVEHVQNCRGVLIRIEGRDSYENEEQMYHASETALLSLEDRDFNFVFDNAGPIDDMQGFAQTVVDYLNV